MSLGRTKISVICRVRPAKPFERADVVEVVDDKSVRLIAPDTRTLSKALQTNLFSFSKVLGPESTQENIYQAVEDVVAKADDGASVVLFAFGVSGSGKTHTMQGTAEEAGLIPRIVARSYATGHAVQAISYYELYQDKVYDLLSMVQGARHPPALDIREAQDGRVFVANLSQEQITNEVEFERVYLAAGSRRHVSATNLNQASSRSHAILELHLSTGGRITLCDLAGSENNKRTGNEHSKERMRESSDINLSLHTLQSCVKALNRGDARVPYRDSKLTRILSDALGGNAVGMLITCIAPEAGFYNDTKNSLAFASLSRNVESRPSVVPEPATRPILRARTTNFAAAALATISEKARNSLPIPLSPRSSRPMRNLTGMATRAAAVGAVGGGMTAEQLEAHIQKRVSELWQAKVKAETSKSPLRKRVRDSPGPENETKRLKRENEELWKRLERLERLVAPLPNTHSSAGDLAGESDYEASFSFVEADSTIMAPSTRAMAPLPINSNTSSSTMARLPLKISRNPLVSLGLSPSKPLPLPGRA